MTEAPKILLAHHLKTLKLPTFLNTTSSPANAPPRDWTMSSSWPGWSNWS